MTKEEDKQYYEAMNSYHKELDEKWNKAKKELQGLIHPKYFDFAENNETYYSDGIVEIQEISAKPNYPNRKYCKIKNGGDGGAYEHNTDNIEMYDKESQYEGEPVEYWVWQTTGYCEDDYSGFLLLPLLDGRFWKVGYSC